MVHLMVPCFDWGLGPMPGEFTRRGVSKFGNSWFVASGDTPCRHTPKTSQSQTQHSNATSKIPSWPLCLHRKQHCRKNCSDDQCMNVMPAMLILEVPSLCTLLYPCRLHKNVLGVRKGLCRQPHAWQGRAFHSWDAGHTWRVNVEKEFQFHSPWQHNWSCVMFVHLSFTELESTLDFSETTCSVVYVCICHISQFRSSELHQTWPFSQMKAGERACLANLHYQDPLLTLYLRGFNELWCLSSRF